MQNTELGAWCESMRRQHALLKVLYPSQAEAPTSALMRTAITGVLRLAEDGGLPLFALTLGLPQDGWRAMLWRCLPELADLEPLSEVDYAAIGKMAPDSFFALAKLLYDQRSPALPEASADWLARAIAAACHGSRHLWQDLDLADREELSRLFACFFPALHARNKDNRKWKRLLLSELAASSGSAAMPLLGCTDCAELSTCFPPD